MENSNSTNNAYSRGNDETGLAVGGRLGKSTSYTLKVIVVLETIGMLCILAGFFLRAVFEEEYVSVARVLFFIGIGCAFPIVFYILTRPFAFMLPRYEQLHEQDKPKKPSKLGDNALNIGILFELVGIFCLVAAFVVFMLFEGKNEGIYLALAYIGMGCAIPALIYMVIFVLVRRHQINSERKNIYVKLKSANADLDAERANLAEVRAQLAEYDAFMQNQTKSDTVSQEQFEIMAAEKAAIEQKLLKYESGSVRSTTTQLAQEARQKIAEERKKLFTKENLDTLVARNFASVAVCFLMNRDAYKDAYGLAPYNKIAITTVDGLKHPKFSMAKTPDRFYRFSETLVDVENFLTHPHLYLLFTDFIKQGMTLVRIAEKLHRLCIQNFKADFVKDYRKREDFDNLLVLVHNRETLGKIDFTAIFTNIPFSPQNFTDEELVLYLTDDITKERFTTAFPDYIGFGFENLETAMLVCFFESIKNKCDPQFLVDAILKDTDRIAKLIIKKNKARK